MRRWELVASYRDHGGHDGRHRFWTVKAARRQADWWRLLGLDTHFTFTLTDRFTGTRVEL